MSLSGSAEVRRFFPWRLFKRMVLGQTLLILLALAAAGWAARHHFKTNFLLQVENQLRLTLSSLAQVLPPPNAAETWCRNVSAGSSLRLTLILPDGKVLCDSHHDATSMENHGARPEVRQALEEGFGRSVRYSSTLGEGMVYGAIRKSSSAGGAPLVLRAALPLDDLSRTLRIFDTSLALILCLTAALLSAFAVWFGRSLANPIGRLLHQAQNVVSGRVDPVTDETQAGAFGELSDLEDSLNEIRKDLRGKTESLTRERDEQATLMGALSDAILAVDLEGTPLFFNTRFAVLSGRTDLGGGKVRLWEMFRDPELLDAFRTCLKEGRPVPLEAISLPLDGKGRFFSVAIAPLTKSSGAVYGAVGIFHDVTELKRAEQIRIDFVANVSHELRTPLTAIKGFTDTLKTDLEKGTPASKDFVEVISKNTSRLMSLIDDLLDLSSLESRAEELQSDLLSTRDATEKVIKNLTRTFATKDQSVTTAYGAATLKADPSRLEQVLINLLDNASKYTPAGGRISVSWEEDPRGATLLKVSDTGPGIAPEHLPRLFERFYRVDKARSRALGGTGLGLAIVKHILQRHGGTVWAESVQGLGSTFVCRFPA